MLDWEKEEISYFSLLCGEEEKLCVQSEVLDNETVFPVKPSLWGSHDNTKISNHLVSLSSIMLRPQKKLCVQSELLDDEIVFRVKPLLWGSHDNTKRLHFWTDTQQINRKATFVNNFPFAFFWHFPQKNTINKRLLLFLRLNGFLLFLVLIIYLLRMLACQNSLSMLEFSIIPKKMQKEVVRNNFPMVDFEMGENIKLKKSWNEAISSSRFD